jgi:hypothetical protein
VKSCSGSSVTEDHPAVDALFGRKLGCKQLI